LGDNERTEYTESESGNTPSSRKGDHWIHGESQKLSGHSRIDKPSEIIRLFSPPTGETNQSNSSPGGHRSSQLCHQRGTSGAQRSVASGGHATTPWSPWSTHGTSCWRTCSYALTALERGRRILPNCSTAAPVVSGVT